jgi:hypothetical protein
VNFSGRTRPPKTMPGSFLAFVQITTLRHGRYVLRLRPEIGIPPRLPGPLLEGDLRVHLLGALDDTGFVGEEASGASLPNSASFVVAEKTLWLSAAVAKGAG